jgi:hypothetical protein
MISVEASDQGRDVVRSLVEVVSKASVGLGDWVLCDGGWSEGLGIGEELVRDPG